MPTSLMPEHERIEAFARRARTLTDDPEAQCVARILGGVASGERKRLRGSRWTWAWMDAATAPTTLR
jgi:hypothetical protein